MSRPKPRPRPTLDQLVKEYEVDQSLRVLAKRYRTTQTTIRNWLEGVDLQAIRLRARSVQQATVINEYAFRFDLREADGVFNKACEDRGISRHVYIQALRAGGVSDEAQARIIDEVREERCLHHYMAFNKETRRVATSFELQKKRQWLYKRIVRTFGSWTKFAARIGVSA